MVQFATLALATTVDHPYAFAFVIVFMAGVLFGAMAFRKNPLKGARTLDELDGWYEEAKAEVKKISAKL